jgi:hypothetical protein
MNENTAQDYFFFITAFPGRNSLPTAGWEASGIFVNALPVIP